MGGKKGKVKKKEGFFSFSRSKNFAKKRVFNGGYARKLKKNNSFFRGGSFCGPSEFQKSQKKVKKSEKKGSKKGGQK